MQCWINRRCEERKVEINVPAGSNVAELLKRQAARDFDWPLSEIIFVHGRHVIPPSDTVDPDAAGSAMTGERFDRQS
jgi:hypothetical protein